ncbi:MAG: hypothetical protein N4J56_004985 [Chroococcidiopsis sp. SAG 2025]|uniref:hypothetical protein n=1 Tax=Chroococcidiopsis sp. SAG 2025 TaxID=171389 RepID=UPI002936E184|nr:hypothetical protein [Chroococcidiopsis sp. SAG 2025]MDV2995331.1 hypothetical protein [Chroococcidiopsis sp. SAG 2025]
MRETRGHGDTGTRERRERKVAEGVEGARQFTVHNSTPTPYTLHPIPHTPHFIYYWFHQPLVTDQ